MKIYSIIIILLVQFQIKAQEDLSLEDAIKVGLAQNFDILIAGKNVEITRNNNTKGQAGALPTVDVNLQQGNNISDQSNNPTSFIQEIIRSHSLQGGVNLNWVLFNGFKVQANKEKLQYLQEQSEGNASLIVENTVQAITLAYYNAILQRKKIALLENVLELSKDKYEYQKVKQELGTAVTVDLLQFKTAYLTDSASFVMQELAYKNAIKNLNLLMGVDIATPWNLTTDLLVDMPLYDVEELENKALGNSQTIKNQLINLELSKQEAKIAKANLYPVLAFNAGAQSSSSKFYLGSFSQGGSTLNYFGNFTLSYRLFDGGKIKRAIQNMEIREEISQLNIDKAKLQISQELRIQTDNYNARTTLFSIRKQAFEVAKENLQIAHLKENNGLINSFNLREVEMIYLQSGVALFETVYSIIESKTNIERLSGNLLSGMVE